MNAPVNNLLVEDELKTPSSPGLSRRAPSFGEVSAVSATKFADDPEFTRSASDTPR